MFQFSNFCKLASSTVPKLLEKTCVSYQLIKAYTTPYTFPLNKRLNPYAVAMRSLSLFSKLSHPFGLQKHAFSTISSAYSTPRPMEYIKIANGMQIREILEIYMLDIFDWRLF